MVTEPLQTSANDLGISLIIWKKYIQSNFKQNFATFAHIFILLYLLLLIFAVQGLKFDSLTEQYSCSISGTFLKLLKFKCELSNEMDWLLLVQELHHI